MSQKKYWLVVDFQNRWQIFLMIIRGHRTFRSKKTIHGLLEPILNRLQDSLLPAQNVSVLKNIHTKCERPITDYSEKIKDLLLFINWIEATRDAGSWTVYGVPKILDNIYFLSHGKNAPQSCRSTIKACRTINFIGLLLLLSAGFIWLFFRIRLFPPKPKNTG